MRYTFRRMCGTLCSILPGILLLVLAVATATAQDSLRYYRVYLKDKGTPARVIHPGDPLYVPASAHLTERALARRRKVLPADSIVSTADLPIPSLYLNAIASTGAEIVQSSRWLNTVMVRADSNAFRSIARLSFIDSVYVTSSRRAKVGDPMGKMVKTAGMNMAGADPFSSRSEYPAERLPLCITDHYGKARRQNDAIRIAAAHSMGVAGEGVLIGILDSGFDWREHKALRNLNVIAERDFVYDDSLTSDEPDEGPIAESHGTEVMGIIGGLLPDSLIGGAIHASFALAKTEDIRFERSVEEDNFVAGLEWLESLGVDVTNTSLGYTEFDFPERNYIHAEFDGRTAHSSRGVNHAVRLGVVCVVAAGNDANKSWHYVGAPAEADSAIAIAAVTPTGSLASFSSRGFGGRLPVKPDLAAMGTENWVVNHNDTLSLHGGQGTSYAAPSATAAVALLLSARPWLTPWEVRSILQRTASRSTEPDTAVGYGIIDIDRALSEMSRTAPVVGAPKALLKDGKLTIAAGVRYEGGMPNGSMVRREEPTRFLDLRVRKLGSAASRTIETTQPFIGVARWFLPAVIAGEEIREGDTIVVMMIALRDGRELRSDTLRMPDGAIVGLRFPPVAPRFAVASTLCESIEPPVTSIATASPNPFTSSTVISFQLEERTKVSLIVYNALGEEMARLIEATEIDAGFHTALFEGAGLPSGAYYYMLRAGEDTRSGHMIYLH